MVFNKTLEKNLMGTKDEGYVQSWRNPGINFLKIKVILPLVSDLWKYPNKTNKTFGELNSNVLWWTSEHGPYILSWPTSKDLLKSALCEYGIRSNESIRSGGWWGSIAIEEVKGLHILSMTCSGWWWRWWCIAQSTLTTVYLRIRWLQYLWRELAPTKKKKKSSVLSMTLNFLRRWIV